MDDRLLHRCAVGAEHPSTDGRTGDALGQEGSHGPGERRSKDENRERTRL